MSYAAGFSLPRMFRRYIVLKEHGIDYYGTFEKLSLSFHDLGPLKLEKRCVYF